MNHHVEGLILQRDEARQQCRLLQHALAKVLQRDLVIRADCLPSGPELLVAAEDYVASAPAMRAPCGWSDQAQVRVVPRGLFDEIVTALAVALESARSQDALGRPDGWERLLGRARECL